MNSKLKVSSGKKETNSKNPVSSVRHKPLTQSGNSSAGQVLQLQQTLGNQEVQRLIKSGKIRTKLTIGKPNDKYEQEADRIADKVMSIPEPKGSLVNGHWSLVQRESPCPGCPEKEEVQTKLLVNEITSLVQRQAAEEEEEIQRQPEEEEETGPYQAKQVLNQTPANTSGIETRVNSLKGGGQPLSESTRSYFEPRFGADFSHVRVHTGSQAAETAQSINAKAFTTGKDVVFGSGQYSPETSTGKQLLAHELTHVVQQQYANELGIQKIIDKETQKKIMKGDQRKKMLKNRRSKKERQRTKSESSSEKKSDEDIKKAMYKEKQKEFEKLYNEILGEINGVKEELDTSKNRMINPDKKQKEQFEKWEKDLKEMKDYLAVIKKRFDGASTCKEQEKYYKELVDEGEIIRSKLKEIKDKLP